MAKVLELGPDALLNLIKRPDIQHEFAFARTLAATAKGSGCGRCGRKRSSRTVSHNDVARAIAQLPIKEKAKLKTKLGADLVRMEYKAGAKVYKIQF